MDEHISRHNRTMMFEEHPFGRGVEQLGITRSLPTDAVLSGPDVAAESGRQLGSLTAQHIPVNSECLLFR